MSLEDIQKLQQEQVNILRPPKSSNKLLWGKELKNALSQAKKDEIARINAEQDLLKTDGKKKEVNALSPAQVVKVLKEYVLFCIFDEDDGTKIAMYQPNIGIWTQNITKINRVIAYMEYGSPDKKFKEIRNTILLSADIKPKTVNKNLIPVKNGIYNLKTKTLEEFNPEYIFTSTINTKYNPDIVEPNIDGWKPSEWLDSLACGDEEIRLLLLQVIADAVNGNYSRKKAIWLYGNGSNGKGTFQALLMNIIGRENIATLKVNQFSDRFALSQLVGKTAVIGDDVNAGIYIDDSSDFNSVVTNDSVKIEYKHENPYSTVLYCTVIQSTNGMPTIRNKTDGTYRRLLIVPFEAKFKGDGDNWKIKDEYIKKEEVREWFLYQALQLDFEKFIEPHRSRELLEQYKQDNDPVAEFKAMIFDELVASGMTRIPTSTLYELFNRFCEEQNYKRWSQKTFNKQLKELIGDDWEQSRMRYLPQNMGDLEALKEKGISIQSISPKVYSINLTWVYSK